MKKENKKNVPVEKKPRYYSSFRYGEEVKNAIESIKAKRGFRYDNDAIHYAVLSAAKK